jgi:hypothetical protein
MFELESENLTGLGGPMGSERAETNWRKFFKTVRAAKDAAEKDYGREIEWDKRKGPTRNLKPIDLTCSGDLGHVMYHIKRVRANDQDDR